MSTLAMAVSCVSSEPYSFTGLLSETNTRDREMDSSINRLFCLHGNQCHDYSTL